MNRNFKHKQQGFSITDFALWVCVSAICLFVIYGLVGPMMTSQKSNGILAELNTFQVKIHEAYNGQTSGYEGISTPEVIKSHAYPTNLNSNGTSLQSTNTGTISISSDDGSGQSFSIEYSAVPTGVCSTIISRVASAGGWIEIDVGGTAIWSGTNAIPTKDEIDSKCGAAATVAMKFISN